MPRDLSPSMLSALLPQERTAEEAYTLIKREVITPLIIDGRFQLATPKAQGFYGLTEKEMLEGAWQSFCQPLDEFRFSRTLAAARHHLHPIPTCYISQLQKPNGEIVNVVKNTREVTIDGVSYWLTHISLAADDPHHPTAAELAKSLDMDQYLDFGGAFCLAEVYNSLGIDRTTLNRRHTLSRVSQSMPDHDEKMTAKKRSKWGRELVFGQPVNRIANGQIIFECQSCGQVWLARKLKTELGEVWDTRLSQRCSHAQHRCYDWLGDYTKQEALALFSPQIS